MRAAEGIAEVIRVVRVEEIQDRDAQGGRSRSAFPEGTSAWTDATVTRLDASAIEVHHLRRPAALRLSVLPPPHPPRSIGVPVSYRIAAETGSARPDGRPADPGAPDERLIVIREMRLMTPLADLVDVVLEKQIRR